MTVSAPQSANPCAGRHRYLRAPAPLFFPVEAEMPETRRHLEQRTILFEIVRDTFGAHATVGSEQFIYWDPTDPRQCCAPDLFVRLGARDTRFDSWKVWERGAPELVVEIISPSDAAEGPWDRKLEHFRRLGALEVVRFDPESREQPLRIWDAIDGDLVERDPSDQSFARCDTLGLHFCVRHDAQLGPMLRLARDAEGRDLLPTPDEALQLEIEARQQADEARRQAERRNTELEAEIAKLRGG
jgi:Uma2 family endonuclease